MKTNRKEFYIGWQPDMPPQHKTFIRRIVIGLLIVLAILVAVVALLQRQFNNYQFEYGNVRTVTGIYYHSPFPMLIADAGELPDSLSRSLLLVGYGKFGAEETMNEIQQKEGDLSGKKITLNGTLIYGDGKTLFELTLEGKSLVKVVSDSVAPLLIPSPSVAPIWVKGEIIEPKCYFGVMKPGEGKTHQSCAIRCISGGIPPVFKHQTGDPQQPYRYYLLLGEDGATVNREVLPFVAELIMLEGKTTRYYDWEVLYFNWEKVSRVSIPTRN